MLDKHLIAVSIAGTLLAVLFLFLMIFLVLVIRKRLNQDYLEKQHLMEANLKEGERTMNQVAKEVHDNIGQLGHLLFMTLRRFEKAPNISEQQKFMPGLYEIANMIISSSENISQSLDSDSIRNTGFCNAFQQLIEQVRASKEVKCDFDIIGEVRSMHPNRELFIYRIAQEAMHNALKHAKASVIKILFQYNNDCFLMEIKDDGRGFDTKSSAKGRMGLRNMKERAKVLNGKLNIESEPGKGCQITLSCPV